MKKAFFALLVFSFGLAPSLKAYEIRLFVDTSTSSIGLFPDAQTGSVYLRTSATSYNFGEGTEIIDSINSISLGTYAFSSTLTVDAAPISLGLINAAITNGIDEHLQIIIKTGGTTLVMDKLESAWFSSATDLVGQDISGATFHIDMVKSGAYSPGTISQPFVYYIDTAVTIQAIPELSTVSIWTACGVLLYIQIRKKIVLVEKANRFRLEWRLVSAKPKN